MDYLMYVTIIIALWTAIFMLIYSYIELKFGGDNVILSEKRYKKLDKHIQQLETKIKNLENHGKK